MAKKSNKTAHVLNLLTNNRDSTDETEIPNAAAPPAKGPPARAAEPETDAPAAFRPKLQFTGDTEDALSEQIRQQLEQLLVEETENATAGAPMLAERPAVGVLSDPVIPQPSNSDPPPHPPDPDPVVEPAAPPAREPEATDSADPNDLLLQVKKLVQDKQTGTSEPQRPDASPPALIVDPIPTNPDYITENKKESGVTMSEENLQPNIHTGNDYVTVNIVEDIVKSKAHDYAIKLGGCGCYRCVSDIIALTLNSLKPQYIVTHKGMLFAKISSYENQYAADISAALTKACMMVKESPRH